MPTTVTDENRTKFDLLAEKCDGVLVLNDASNIVYADAKILDFLGYEAGDLVGESVNLLLPRSQHEVHADKVKHFKATGELQGKMNTTPIAAYGKDGKTHDMRGAPCFIDGFAVVGICNPEIRAAEVQEHVDAIKD